VGDANLIALSQQNAQLHSDRIDPKHFERNQLWLSTHSADPVSADLSSKHRTEPVPPVPHRFAADVDAALVEQIFHISKQQ
jgi:hypothetical protein